MPTELPIRRPLPPRATKNGNLFFAAAVLAMFAISAFVLMRPDAVAGSLP